ncbi:MAG: molecular chaperone TorD family protein [Deltaproteobacteria bacterium]|nr:molecular chaperone TorD family protein [Deltaproteobacteria bacterium]
MDLENSENKKINYAVLEGVEIMCRVFWGPDLESCRHMIEGNFFQSFEITLTIPEAKPSVILDNINSIINRFDTPQSLFHHLNECYVRLFVNNKEGITTPLYQSCYEFENAPMMGESAIKMNKRFKSKGLSMENRVHEPPDHLAIELEYLFFLLQDSSVGLNDNPDKFVSNEAVSFAAETMLPWVTVFNQRLKPVIDDCRFYSLASGILVLLLSLISDK